MATSASASPGVQPRGNSISKGGWGYGTRRQALRDRCSRRPRESSCSFAESATQRQLRPPAAYLPRRIDRPQLDQVLPQHSVPGEDAVVDRDVWTVGANSVLDMALLVPALGWWANDIPNEGAHLTFAARLTTTPIALGVGTLRCMQARNRVALMASRALASADTEAAASAMLRMVAARTAYSRHASRYLMIAWSPGRRS